MIIIEFCGIPCCGKSTKCKELKQFLSEQGYRVRYLFNNYYSKNILHRIKKKWDLYIYRKFFDKSNMKKTFDILNPFCHENSLIDWNDRVMEDYYKCQKAEKKGIDIVLFDEGYLQLITSVFHEREVDYDAIKFVRIIQEEVYRNRTIFVDCQIPIEESYRRLVNRGWPYSYLDGNDEQNKMLLGIKRTNLNIVLNMVNLKDIVRIDSNQDNYSEVIVSKIKTLL